MSYKLFFCFFLGGSPFPHFSALRRHTREFITLNCILCAILVLQTLSLSLSFSLFLSSVFTRRRLHHLEKKKSDESNKAVKREHASFVVFCLEKRASKEYNPIDNRIHFRRESLDGYKEFSSETCDERNGRRRRRSRRRRTRSV